MELEKTSEFFKNVNPFNVISKNKNRKNNNIGVPDITTNSNKVFSFPPWFDRYELCNNNKRQKLCSD